MRTPPPPPPDERRGRRSDRNEGESRSDKSDVSLGAAIGLGVGLFLVVGAHALYSWFSSTPDKEVENGYYCLPPRNSCEAAAAEAAAQGDGVGGEEDGYAGPTCVCCRDRPQRYMFVQCHHICLCEPCLIRLARDYEARHVRGGFDGPVKLACPVCRQVGNVVKTYAS